MEKRSNRLKQDLKRIVHDKKRRELKARIRMACLATAAAAVILLIAVGIISLRGYIKTHKQSAPPEPVKVMSYNEFSPEDENYIEPEATPTPYIFDGNHNRLESAVSAGGKACYLTFDDGPNISITPQVLDVLRRYDVKATFFEVGTLIESNPNIARRVYEEGHLIANHSYSHGYKNLYSSAEAFMTEIRRTGELIKEIQDPGVDVFPLIRFPGGGSNSGKYGEQKKQIKTVLDQDGYLYCDWNSLNGDAQGNTKTAEELFDYFKKNTKLSAPVVVLMHDAVTKQATVDCLPSIIEYMLENGYTFLRLDEAL